jgi:23S rRNA (guanosine2251-2'-O)-methyltransferase
VDVWLYGFHAVKALLDTAPERALSLHYLAEGDDRRKPLLEKAKSYGIAVTAVNRKQLDDWLENTTHQGIALKIKPQKMRDENDLDDILAALKVPPFLLVLDGVQDPHNLGACLRTAEAVGAHAVIIPEHRAVGLTPVVRKVACGATEWLPVIQVGNLARVLKLLKEQGIWLYATDSEAKKSIYSSDLRGPIAWVMGAEGSGVRRLTAELCDTTVSIPLKGHVESLNVSVATALCLYETLRQRGTA